MYTGVRGRLRAIDTDAHRTTHVEPTVFICYAREDAAVVYPEVEWLRTAGIDVHIDRGITPGHEWREAVADSIASSDVCLFYVSPSSVQSEYCRQEIGYALSRHRRVITIYLRPTELPGALALALGDIQALMRDDYAEPTYREMLLRGLTQAPGVHMSRAAAALGPQRRLWRHPVPVAVLAAVLATVGLAAAFTLLRPQVVTPVPDTPTEVAANSIAVLRFEDLSEQGDLGYVADGLAEVLTQRLGALSTLTVTSRIAAWAVPPGTPPRQLRDRLKARFLLAGTIRRQDERLRVMVELVDTTDGRQVWKQGFERPGERVFLLQDELARSVAAGLAQVIPGVDLGRAPEVSTRDPEAWDLYLQAREVLRGPGEAIDHASAEQLLRRALDRQPGFGLALSGLCETLVQRFDASRDAQLLTTAERTCGQALAVASGVPETHLALGQLYLLKDERGLALTHFQRALALNASSAEALVGLGHAHEQSGQAELARGYLEQAVVVQPASWRAHSALGNFYFRHGRAADAIEHYRQVTRLAPELAQGHGNLGAAHYMLGDFAAAAAAWEHSLALAPSAMTLGNIGAARLFLGQYSAAASAYRRAAELAPEDHRWWGHLAEALLLQPETAQQGRAMAARALQLAERQLSVNPADAMTLARVSTYQAILDHPDVGATVEAAAALAPDDMYVAYSILQTWSVLHDRKRALAARGQVLALGYPPDLLAIDPTLADFTDD